MDDMIGEENEDVDIVEISKKTVDSQQTVSSKRPRQKKTIGCILHSSFRSYRAKNENKNKNKQQLMMHKKRNG